MAETNSSIHTSGGPAVGGDANVGGDFIARDRITINFFGAHGPWVEEVSKLLPRPEDRTAAQPWTTFDWAQAEQAYRDKLIRLYDRVRILGKPGDQPLGDLFTAVYILDKPTVRFLRPKRRPGNLWLLPCLRCWKLAGWGKSGNGATRNIVNLTTISTPMNCWCAVWR